MPVTVGLMLQSLLLSFLLLGLMALGIPLDQQLAKIFEKINFNVLLLEGLLSFLIFAGALFVKNEEILEVKVEIAVFALAGVILSTGIIGGGLYAAAQMLGLSIRPLYCFLFGALISPTDPVAVLPTLRNLGIHDRLNAQIAGEAMFNDGVGIVLFLSLLAFIKEGSPNGPTGVTLLFLQETAGGIIFGLLLGWLGYSLMKTVDNYQLEILITLAIVSGGYSMATVMNISGPLAMVLAGLFIGGRGRKLAMSERTRDNLDRFWELVEEMLNAILFTLIGLEILVIVPRLTPTHLIIGSVAIPLVLAGRYLSIGSLRSILRRRNSFASRSVQIMTWSGLRGAIPIALAISIPAGSERTIILFATYLVVAFSILVQGTTLNHLVTWHQRQ
nr:sodium:proton antiporter [Geotalea sp. SG265]